MAQAVTVADSRGGEGLRPTLLLFVQSKMTVAAFWAAAVFSWLLLIRKSSSGGDQFARFGGGDFFQIWKGLHAFDGGQPMYFQNGSIMSFLYPPSAGLLLAPLGALPFNVARVTFAVLQAIAISVAIVLALQLTGRLRTWTVPLAILAGSLAFPVRNSMWVGNLDGVILALELAMLVCAARGRWGWAAIAFGVGLALKPVLLPLALIFIFARQWKTLGIALLIPAVTSAFAVAMGRDGIVFITRVIPYLLGGQSSGLQVDNVSLAGAAVAMHLPTYVTVVMRIAIVAAMAALLAAAWRRRRDRADAGVRLAEAASIVMLTVLISFSYSWDHYIVFLLPLFALYGSDRSIIRGWLAAAAIYLLLVPDDAIWARVSIPLTQLRPTFGMLLLAAALGLALASETRRRRDHASWVAPGTVVAR